MSPRRGRGVCTVCAEPSRARGLCWRHYRIWRTTTPEEQRERIPQGALVAREVAEALGITTDALTRRIAKGGHRPDGRAEGRNWWWPATVAGWDVQQPPADSMTVAQVAARLGLSTRRVHRLADNGDLPEGGRHGGRRVRWWHRSTVEEYECSRPRQVLWSGDVAERLGVSRETVRRLSATSLPPDGIRGGRRWWLPSRFESQSASPPD